MEYCKKVSFKDEASALFYIDKLNKTSKRNKIPVRTYLCEKCFNWHLTSKEQSWDSDESKNDLKKELDELRNSIKIKGRKLKILSKSIENRERWIKNLTDHIIVSFDNIIIGIFSDEKLMNSSVNKLKNVFPNGNFKYLKVSDLKINEFIDGYNNLINLK